MFITLPKISNYRFEERYFDWTQVVVVCEESGLVSLNCNVLITTPKASTIVELVVSVVTAKSTLTYTNCGKTCHTLETCHNRAREVLVVLTATIKSIEPIVETKTR